MVATDSKWNLSSWNKGKVRLFDAFGLHGAQYPQLQARLVAGAASNSVPLSQFAPQASTTTAGNGTASGGSSNGAPPAIGSCNSATTAANKRLMQQKATAYGWGTGSEWDALNNLEMSEAGYCNTIKNPSSTAYGIGQFLDTTWATVGGTKTSSAATQIDLMLKYIKIRYKTPSAAWAFHLKNNYY